MLKTWFVHHTGSRRNRNRWAFHWIGPNPISICRQRTFLIVYLWCRKWATKQRESLKVDFVSNPRTEVKKFGNRFFFHSDAGNENSLYVSIYIYIYIYIFLNLIDPEGNDICQVYINGSIHQVGSVVCTYRGLDWRGHAGTQDIWLIILRKFQ